MKITLLEIAMLGMAGSLLAVPAAAQAQQQPPAQGGAPAQVSPNQADPNKGKFVFLSPNYFVVQATVIKHDIDAGRVGVVYDSATDALKSRETKADFAAKQAKIMQEQTKRFGTAVPPAPIWQGIELQKASGAAHGGAGPYLSVTIATPLNKSWGREDVVTFHLDDDHNWRFSNYTSSFISASKILVP